MSIAFCWIVRFSYASPSCYHAAAQPWERHCAKHQRQQRRWSTVLVLQGLTAIVQAQMCQELLPSELQMLHICSLQLIMRQTQMEQEPLCRLRKDGVCNDGLLDYVGNAVMAPVITRVCEVASLRFAAAAADVTHPCCACNTASSATTGINSPSCLREYKSRQVIRVYRS